MKALQEFARWKALKAAADAQWDVVEAVAIAERGIAEGDTVQIGKKVGRVKAVRVRVDWKGVLEIAVFAMLFKKNGDVALVGEFDDRFGSPAVLVSKAEAK